MSFTFYLSDNRNQEHKDIWAWGMGHWALGMGQAGSVGGVGGWVRNLSPQTPHTPSSPSSPHSPLLNPTSEKLCHFVRSW
ncbi:MAG: hypothetical protein RMY29_020395 [Nostoc sp. CreGUA01]|nr:hypothetical protein [Nostoc sp. CreGUA01]